jgi:hypothetical protein
MVKAMTQTWRQVQDEKWRCPILVPWVGGMTVASLSRPGAHCGCPDDEVPCQPIAASLHVFAQRFDDDPRHLPARKAREREALMARKACDREPLMAGLRLPPRRSTWTTP